MCYLIVKDRYKPGCYALESELGQDLYAFYRALLDELDSKQTHLQLVTLNRPDTYGEYAPYHFVTNKEEFRKQALKMKQNILQNKQ